MKRPHPLVNQAIEGQGRDAPEQNSSTPPDRRSEGRTVDLQWGQM